MYMVSVSTLLLYVGRRYLPDDSEFEEDELNSHSAYNVGGNGIGAYGSGGAYGTGFDGQYGVGDGGVMSMSMGTMGGGTSEYTMMEGQGGNNFASQAMVMG